MSAKNIKFLVTGGAGFIGSQIVKQLLDAGYAVRVVDDLSKKQSSVDGRAEFIKADLSDFKKTKQVFKNINICINAAAKIGGIGYFHKYPATILSENNKIYSSTFEAAVAAGIDRMVYISSSMVFESATEFPSKEDDIKKIPPPISSYGFSKLSGEWYCRAYWAEYRLPYAICRPFNAYGVNEYPEREVGYAHVIPDLIRKILTGQYPLELLGNGQQTRCFTHVSDVASGIIAVAVAKNGQNDDFNIGSDREIKIIDLAKKLWQIVGVKRPFKVRFVPGFKFDIRKRVPNVQKVKKMINWEPVVDLEKGLKEVVDWLKVQKAEGKF